MSDSEFSNIDKLPLGKLLQPTYAKGKKVDEKKKKQRDSLAARMQAPAAMKDYGTEEGYGATPEDQPQVRKPVNIVLGKKPKRKRLGDEARRSLEAEAREKNRRHK